MLSDPQHVKATSSEGLWGGTTPSTLSSVQAGADQPETERPGGSWPAEASDPGAARHGRRRGTQTGQVGESQDLEQRTQRPVGAQTTGSPAAWQPRTLRPPVQRRLPVSWFTWDPRKNFGREGSPPWGAHGGSESPSARRELLKRGGVTMGRGGPTGSPEPGEGAEEGTGNGRETPADPTQTSQSPGYSRPRATGRPDAKGSAWRQLQAAAPEFGGVRFREPPEPHRPRGGRRTRVG